MFPPIPKPRKKIKHLDLFTGIGGFALAAQWVWGNSYKPILFCEIDKFCQKVLKKHWPDVPIISNIRDLNGEEYKETIDILTGGFPCQSFSVAGKQKGKKDDRYLWPEMFRVIKQTKPTWVIGENVANIINMALDQVLFDLETENYTTQSFIIPACSVNAPHRRDRVWIMAHANSTESSRSVGKTSNERNTNTPNSKFSSGSQSGGTIFSVVSKQNVANTNSKYSKKQQRRNQLEKEIKEMSFRWSYTGDGGQWEIEPNVGRVANGVSNRVDRLKCLGNAIVPQIAATIMQAIKEYDK